MCCHKDGLAFLQLWGDGLLPVGHHACNGVLQALGIWQVLERVREDIAIQKVKHEDEIEKTLEKNRHHLAAS